MHSASTRFNRAASSAFGIWQICLGYQGGKVSFSTCTIFCTLLVSRDESRQQWNMRKRPFPAIAKDMMHWDSHSSTPSVSHALYSHATRRMCRRVKLPSPVTLLVTQMDRVAEVGRSFPGKRDRASKPEPPCASALHHLRINTPHTFLLHVQLPLNFISRPSAA